MADCGGALAPPEIAIFSAVTEAVLTPITIIGNAIVIFVVYKDPLKKLRNPFMYFVVNLAIADLVVGLVYFPVAAYLHVTEAIKALAGDVVELKRMSFFISITASILSLIALTLDRYITVIFPLKYKEYLTLKRCGVITVIIWVISFTIPWGYLEIGFIEYLMVDVLTSIILAFTICIVTYIQLYKSLRKQTAALANQLEGSNSSQSEKFQLKRLEQEKKTTRIFLIVVFVFLATYGPTAIMILILQFCPHCNCYFQQWLRDLTSVLVAFNSTINPFVYTARLMAFRKSLRHLFRRKQIGQVNTSTSNEQSTNLGTVNISTKN